MSFPLLPSLPITIHTHTSCRLSEWFLSSNSSFHVHLHFCSPPPMSSQCTYTLEITRPTGHGGFTYTGNHGLQFLICSCLSAWRRNLTSSLDRSSSLLKTSFKAAQRTVTREYLWQRETMSLFPLLSPNLEFEVPRRQSAQGEDNKAGSAIEAKRDLPRWERKASRGCLGSSVS